MSAPAVHATVVAIDEVGVMIRGPSHAGKSTLAHALIDRARLYGVSGLFVADDRVHLAVEGGRLVARTPEAIAGLAELYGFGIVRVPHVAEATVGVVVDLVPAEMVNRLPEPEEISTEIDGVRLRRQVAPAGRPELAVRLVFAALDALRARRQT